MEHLKKTFDWSSVDASRFASMISNEPTGLEDVVLIGLPDDVGVSLNNGRPGAKDGPRVFRETLARMGTRFDLELGDDLDVKILDAGDVEPAPGNDAAALAETHNRVTEAAQPFYEDGKIVVGIGGGHDLTFAMVRAFSQAYESPVGGVNVDPHLDVRETAGSGMPYRSLIEGGFVDPSAFVEFGAGRFENSKAHVEWAREQGVAVQGVTGVRSGAFQPAGAVQHATKSRDAFISIDLDCVEGLTGVSAVPTPGLPVHVPLSFARFAGEQVRVKHFDIMELSPAHDESNRTARFAVLLFQTFIAGVQRRGV